MKVLIDTNFILTCVKQKIDFLSECHEFLLPEEVLHELEMILKRKGEKIKDRGAAFVALKITKNMKKIKFGNKNVDEGIVNYVKDNPDVVVATLDADLKKKVRKVLVIRDKKMLDIE